jgi:hypothetical protein
MTAIDFIRALKARYAPPSWAFLTEVGNGTGVNCRRHADAVAMGVWPSRGLELYGFEVKVSRSDWKRELENPIKAEEICRFMDRWFIVANPGVVADGELPPTWGLLVPAKDGLRAVTPAPALQPEPISRGFLAALLRKSCEQTVDADKLNEATAAGHKAGLESGREEGKWAREELAELRKTVQAFENASGVRLTGYSDGKHIGEAVRQVLSGFDPMDQIRYLHQRLGKILEEKGA